MRSPATQLAAYRLDRAGCKWRTAYQELPKYRDKNRIPDSVDVLPIYDSPGGWSDAVNDAKGRIPRLHPRPPHVFIR